jgi:hypothetical protein
MSIPTEIPEFENLMTEEQRSSIPFRKEWRRWLEARQIGPSGKVLARRRVTEPIAEARLEDCAEWGIQRAITALRHSTGYQGLFEPRTNGREQYSAPQQPRYTPNYDPE